MFGAIEIRKSVVLNDSQRISLEVLAKMVKSLERKLATARDNYWEARERIILEGEKISGVYPLDSLLVTKIDGKNILLWVKQ
jgi:hypothetical protein